MLLSTTEQFIQIKHINTTSMDEDFFKSTATCFLKRVKEWLKLSENRDSQKGCPNWHEDFWKRGFIVQRKNFENDTLCWLENFTLQNSKGHVYFAFNCFILIGFGLGISHWWEAYHKDFRWPKFVCLQMQITHKMFHQWEKSLHWCRKLFSILLRSVENKNNDCGYVMFNKRDKLSECRGLHDA